MKTIKTNFLKGSGLVFMLSAVIFSSCDQDNDTVAPAYQKDNQVATTEPKACEVSQNRKESDVLN